MSHAGLHPITVNVSACTQCGKSIRREATPQSRHAVPCAHVICGDCVGSMGAESKHGEVVCRQPHCGKKLAKVSEFPVAWCTQRADRIAATLADLMADQGDVGSDDGGAGRSIGSPAESSSAERKEPSHRAPGDSLATPQVLQERFKAVALSVAECTKYLGAIEFGPAEYEARLDAWVSRETARVRAWETEEDKHIHALADELCDLIGEVRVARAKTASSVFAQRLALQASFDEIEGELAELPHDEAARHSRLGELVAAQEQLAEAAARKMALPSARAIARWAALPSLDVELMLRGTDGPACGTGGSASGADDKPAIETIAAAVRGILTSCRDLRAVAACGRAFHVKTASVPIVVSRVAPKYDSCAFSFLVSSTLISDVREYVLGRAVGLVRGGLAHWIPRGSSPRRILLAMQTNQSRARFLNLGDRRKPTVFLPLDADTVAVAFNVAGSIEVWNLADDVRKREFPGKFSECYAIADLYDGRIAVGCKTDDAYGICFFDVAKGTLVDVVRGFARRIYGLARSGSNLIASSNEGRFASIQRIRRLQRCAHRRLRMTLRLIVWILRPPMVTSCLPFPRVFSLR